jgi:hypothetical protein
VAVGESDELQKDDAIMLTYGTVVRSLRDSRIGTVVGYGTLCWPRGVNTSGDDGPQPCYIVQISTGSMSLLQAAVVMRADQVEVIK